MVNELIAKSSDSDRLAACQDSSQKNSSQTNSAQTNNSQSNGSQRDNLSYLELQQKINHLVDRYLSFAHLDDRLADLPEQFIQPQPRPWQAIDWQAIQREQIVGIDVEVFLAILQGAIDTEAPIRHYTQTSRQYLNHLHPAMAKFVGGTLHPDGTLHEPGMWEKEERQHTPALIKIYAQISGAKPTPVPHNARPYHPPADPRAALYKHGLHRVATEYGATCLYLWLMAHTTGALHDVLEELTQDEINHMTKFWGFGIWAYPETSAWQVCKTLLHTSHGTLTYTRDRSSLLGTLHRMTQELAWHRWTWSNRATFAYASLRTLQRLWAWSNMLQTEQLSTLFENS
jgi:hypothetical protein